MGELDLEAEYNNRARVPDHPAIFERWTRDAAGYRKAMKADNRAELGIRYGPSPRQTLDLFAPELGPSAPIAAFIHGGYWQSLDPSLFSHMARGANERGLLVAVAGYDLCPDVCVIDIVEQIRQVCLHLWRRYGRKLIVFGHSAGGHLAACMVATDWKAIDASLPPDLVPAGLSISGVFDLTPLLRTSYNDNLRLDAAEAEAVSPINWRAPEGLALDVFVGTRESSAFLRQSKLLADAWSANGTATSYCEAIGVNHFTIIDQLTDPQGEIVERIVSHVPRLSAT